MIRRPGPGWVAIAQVAAVIAVVFVADLILKELFR